MKVYLMVKQELESLKLKQKELIEELGTYKDKVSNEVFSIHVTFSS